MPIARRATPVVVAAALILILAACGDSSDTAESGSQTSSPAGSVATHPPISGTTTSAGPPSTPAAATSAAPTPTPDGPGARCGPVQTASGTGQVIIASGRIVCAEALAVVQKYYDLPTDPDGGNTAPKRFDGWFCLTATAASAEARGYGTECSRGGIELRVVIG